MYVYALQTPNSNKLQDCVHNLQNFETFWVGSETFISQMSFLALNSNILKTLACFNYKNTLTQKCVCERERESERESERELVCVCVPKMYVVTLLTPFTNDKTQFP